MSGPERGPTLDAQPGVRLRHCAVDVIEVSALRGRAAELAAIAARRGMPLPAAGHAVAAPDRLVLSFRPDRWLVLTPQSSAGADAIVSEWQELLAGQGVVVDLSSGLAAFHLAGKRIRELLARACRLDLDPGIFPMGHAAVTIMTQVAVTLVALPSGLLLLTPATTARHFREWLAAAAKPFGFMTQANLTVAELAGSEVT